ncbi:MAG: tRNA 2-thiouridine(34) synthase MnmA [Candidatus Cloacimonadota bacterium]|nr:MAG: tRNA 2-thiouridine(34) synthase MnmA [Candidatus Cloacimonadota bacterium]
MDKKKVLCAMSGGVDSSVCAYLLKEMGYEVIGVTMKTWARDTSKAERSCCGIDDIDDARRVAAKLDIPYIALDMEEIFRETIIEDFQSEYLKGRTPNPCIRCNYKLKFGYLMDKANELGAFYVATGHYARLEKIDGRYAIRMGEDANKDQSYVLYNLTQEQLERTLFPLADFEKDRIREIAFEQGFKRVANKPDSQEICFVPDDYRDYLKNSVGKTIKKGTFVDHNGKVLGKHEGIPFYTIGQRKGLGISFPEKTYVTSIDANTNEVRLGSKEQLGCSSMKVEGFNWVTYKPRKTSFCAKVQIRYNQKPVDCMVFPENEKDIIIKFIEPQNAVAPGQSAVLYDNDLVIGGGLIQERL